MKLSSLTDEQLGEAFAAFVEDKGMKRAVESSVAAKCREILERELLLAIARKWHEGPKAAAEEASWAIEKLAALREPKL